MFFSSAIYKPWRASALKKTRPLFFRFRSIQSISFVINRRRNNEIHRYTLLFWRNHIWLYLLWIGYFVLRMMTHILLWCIISNSVYCCCSLMLHVTVYPQGWPYGTGTMDKDKYFCGVYDIINVVITSNCSKYSTQLVCKVDSRLVSHFSWLLSCLIPKE